MRTNPRPTSESMGFYYPDTNGPYQSTRVSTEEAEEPSFWQNVARRLVDFRERPVPVTEPGRMLEVGCASGAYMHRMSSEGWDVSGIEVSAEAAGAVQALGYPVFNGTIEEAPEPEVEYDLIVGWMVLEHLHDPVLALEKLLRWTKPGGWIALSVPNAGAVESGIFGNAWYALQLPTHLFHFTPTTLRRMLFHSGWIPERIIHQRVLTNLIVSTGYRLGDRGLNWLSNLLVELPGKYTRVVYYALYPFAYALAAAGQTGRMVVWARKSEIR